jgi:hypothetical protein
MGNITTKSRRLEQFFYLHGVNFISYDKDDEGMTVWEYEDNEENRHIVSEFKTALARLANKKGA